MKRRKIHNYTEQEVEFIIDNYPNKGAEYVAKSLGLDVCCIHNKYRRIKKELDKSGKTYKPMKTYYTEDVILQAIELRETMKWSDVAIILKKRTGLDVKESGIRSSTNHYLTKKREESNKVNNKEKMYNGEPAFIF